MSYIIIVVDRSPGHSDLSLLADFSTFTQKEKQSALQDQLRSCSWIDQHPLGQSQFWPLVKVISVLAHGCSDCLIFYFPQVNLKRTNATSISSFFKSALEITTKRQLQICTLPNGWATFYMGQGSTLLPAMVSNENTEELCSSLWSAASAEVPACLRVSAPHSFHTCQRS